MATPQNVTEFLTYFKTPGIRYIGVGQQTAHADYSRNSLLIFPAKSSKATALLQKEMLSFSTSLLRPYDFYTKKR
jgi:hypothetical protein